MSTEGSTPQPAQARSEPRSDAEGPETLGALNSVTDQCRASPKKLLLRRKQGEDNQPLTKGPTKGKMPDLSHHLLIAASASRLSSNTLMCSEETDQKEVKQDDAKARKRPSSKPDGDGEPRKRRRRRRTCEIRKKPRDAPKRPVSGYNLFFRAERIKILGERNVESSGGNGLTASAQVATGGKTNLIHSMAKLIGQRWRDLPTGERALYAKQAAQDSERYRQEMEVYKQSKKEQEQKQAEKDSKKRKEEGTANAGGHSQVAKTHVLREQQEEALKQGATGARVDVKSSVCTSAATKAAVPQVVEIKQQPGPLPLPTPLFNGAQVTPLIASSDVSFAEPRLQHLLPANDVAEMVRNVQLQRIQFELQQRQQRLQLLRREMLVQQLLRSYQPPDASQPFLLPPASLPVAGSRTLLQSQDNERSLQSHH